MLTHKSDTAKQCRPRTDAKERGIRLASALFALTLTTSLANTADDQLMIFSLIFPNKRGLTFHSNCLQWR